MATTDFLTDREVDQLLKLRSGSAARWARAGKLPAVVLPDKSIRFRRSDLERLLSPDRGERCLVKPVAVSAPGDFIRLA